MGFVFIMLFVVLVILFFLFFYKSKSVSKEQIKSSPSLERVEKLENVAPLKTESIEILDFDDYTAKDEKLKKEILDETIDLNELFKTMSINIVTQDKSFDFGLLRKRKKKS